MPSLDALLLNSKTAGSFFSQLGAANSNATSASQFSFGGSSAGSPQSSFGDALNAAYGAGNQNASVTSTAVASAKADDQTADQTSWQEQRAERADERASRDASRVRRTKDDQAQSSQDQTTADANSSNANATQTAQPSDRGDTSNDATDSHNGHQGEDDHSHTHSPSEQSAADSTQTKVTDNSPTQDPPPAAAAASAGGPNAPSDKIQAQQPASPAAGDAKSADASQLPPALTLDASQGIGQDGPDSGSQEGLNGKMKPGVPGVQLSGKQAAKIGQDNSEQIDPQAVKPQTTPLNLPQAVQSLAAEAVRNAVNGIASGPDEGKPVAPVASPIVLTTATSPQSTTSSDRADAAAPAQQLPQADQDQTFEQVVMGLRGKLDPQNGIADIQLNPPNLGTLHVSLTLTNGSLTAEFQSPSDVVRNLLSTHMEKLKSALESQGVAVGKIAVEPPADQTAASAAKTPSASPNNNDGRSAGQYSRDPQPGQRRSPGSGTFAQQWRDNGKTSTPQDAPIDVVA